MQQPTQTQQQLQPSRHAQFDGSQYAQFPQQMGAGFPEPVQSFPTDMASLQQLITTGYSPGATPQQHDGAVNAHALARAQERVAMQQVQDAEDEQVDQGAMAELMQRMLARRGATASSSPAPQGAAPSPTPY